MEKEKKNATEENIKKYVDQAMQASVPKTTQTIVILVALCTDTDPMKVQGYYMDSQFFIDKGFSRLVTGEAAKERLEQNYNPLESDT